MNNIYYLVLNRTFNFEHNVYNIICICIELRYYKLLKFMIYVVIILLILNIIL